MRAITKIAMVLAILYIPLAVVAFFSYPIYLLFGKEE